MVMIQTGTEIKLFDQKRGNQSPKRTGLCKSFDALGKGVKKE